MNISDLEQRINYRFRTKALLTQALTHRSYLNEHRTHSTANYERLEFLGDAVLELVVTDHLFDRFASKLEGELTQMRSLLVCSESLIEVAKTLNLNEYLLLSRGEAKDTKSRGPILVDCVEAIIGALYKDGGISAASAFVHRFVLSRLEVVLSNPKDAKSLLQELVQAKVGITPRYEVISESGPDHDKTFVMGCFLGKQLASKGRGASKQMAEQAAAENALRKVEKGGI